MHLSFEGNIWCSGEIPTRVVTRRIWFLVAVIPKGLVSQLQPSGLFINKPFKIFMREEWHKLEAVKEETFLKSFKKCKVHNVIDGTEDDEVFECIIVKNS